MNDNTETSCHREMVQVIDRNFFLFCAFLCFSWPYAGVPWPRKTGYAQFVKISVPSAFHQRISAVTTLLFIPAIRDEEVTSEESIGFAIAFVLTLPIVATDDRMQRLPMGLFALIILIGLLILGIVLLRIALIDRTLDDHPWCTGCRFDLHLLDNPLNCPECGAELLRHGAVKTGRRQRRKGLA